MAKANPVNSAKSADERLKPTGHEVVVDGPAPAEDIEMPPVKSVEELRVEEAVKLAAQAAAASADPDEAVVALRDAALAEGKNALLVGPRAVRVDH